MNTLGCILFRFFWYFILGKFCAGPVSDDEIRRMSDLEGESQLQRRLRIRIADNISERLGLIKVPVSETWPQLGDSDARMAEYMFQRAMRLAFSSGPPTFLDYVARMNNFLVGLASVDINPRPFIELIKDLGRRLIRVETLKEAYDQRQNSDAAAITQDLKQKLDAAKRELVEAQEASKPLLAERQESLQGIAGLEENIRHREKALAKLRNHLATRIAAVAKLDEQLAMVEQNAVTQANAVQAIEADYIQNRRLVDRQASESEFIQNVINADLQGIGAEAAKLI